MKKTIIAIALLFMASCAVFLLVNKPENPSVSVINTATPTPTEMAFDTTDWKTYTSPRFGYFFSYPQNWYPLFYDEANKAVLYGSHSIANYDFDKVENFMDHGIVDWQKFVGDQTVIKFDLSAQKPEETLEDFIQKNFADATKQTVPDLKFGSLDTTQYNTPSAIDNQLIRSYMAVNNDYIIYANVAVMNQPNQVILQDTSEWKELETIFASFKF